MARGASQAKNQPKPARLAFVIISVVIPARNESRRIGSTLSSLVGQLSTPPFEVIVVDNASTDGTSLAATRFSNKLNLRVIAEPKLGRGAARAHGFGLAKGEIILSTDADTVLPPNWVASLVSLIQSNDCVAVSGTCQINDCSPLTSAIFNWFQPNAMHLYNLVYRHYWLTGSNFGVKKAAYLAAGGFNQDFQDLEDIELGFRLKTIGKVKFFRAPPVVTSGERFKAGLIPGLCAYIKAFIGRFWFNQADRFKRH